jgi:hypothetical protein
MKYCYGHLVRYFKGIQQVTLELLSNCEDEKIVLHKLKAKLPKLNQGTEHF